MSTFWVIFATVLTSWIIAESRDVAGWLAPRLVKWAARRLPPRKAAIREEEWLALLHERTGELKVFRFIYALSFCAASLRMTTGVMFRRWWDIETRAEMWLTEMDGHTVSKGIIVSHKGKQYHFPWAPTPFKGHPNLDYPVEGDAPKKAKRYAGNLWSENFDDGKWKHWPPTQAKRPWLWRNTVKGVGFLAAILVLAIPVILPAIAISNTKDRWRRRKYRSRRNQALKRRETA